MRRKSEQWNIRKPIIKDDTALIPLSPDGYAIIDLCDLPQISKYLWCKRHAPNGRSYARSSDKRRPGDMHRLIMNPPRHLLIDHKDRDGLNNRRANLRLATRSQNAANSKKAEGSINKYKGVHWNGYGFRAIIAKNKKYTSIGSFRTEIEAAKAYDKEALKLFGEFARLNFQQ